MDLAVAVNRLNELEQSQGTASIIAEACARGHRVVVFALDDLWINERGKVGAQVVTLPSDEAMNLKTLASELHTWPRQAHPFSQDELLLIRTNPARDPQRLGVHDTFLTVASLLKRRGMLVLNDPDGLRLAGNKLYLSDFSDAIRPATWLGRDVDSLMAFVRNLSGSAVLKPLQGTWGQDVFLIQHGDHTNLRAIANTVTRSGFALAQAYIPGAESGDTRVILVEGSPLVSHSIPLTVRRIPGKGEFRSNVHAGGSSAAGAMGPGIARIVGEVGARLVADGIFLAGLDIIQGQLVEINVFAPGGFQPATELLGAPFLTSLLEAIEAKEKSHRCA